MTKTTFIFALDWAEKLEAVLAEAAKYFGGYTLRTNQGGWRDNSGHFPQLVHETSYELVIYHEKPEKRKLHNFADFIAWYGGQTEVWYETTSVTGLNKVRFQVKDLRPDKVA